MSQTTLYKYGREVNTHDLVKVLATIVMIIDHIGLYFVDNNDWFRIIGRLAAPLFFMLVGASGAYHQKKELIVYAFILMGFQYYLIGFVPLLNILFSFIIIKYLLNKFDFTKLNDTAIYLLVLFLSLINVFLFSIISYGTLGLLFAIYPVLSRNKHHLADTWLFITITFYGLLCFSEFDETQYHQALVVVIFTIMLLICKFYSFKKIHTQRRWKDNMRVGDAVHLCGDRLILLISRYSLPIYVWHLTLFRAIGVYYEI